MKILNINQVPLLFEVLDKVYNSLRETKDTKYISWNDVAGAKRAACHFVRARENRTRLGRDGRERRALCKSDFLSLNFVRNGFPPLSLSLPLFLFLSNTLSRHACCLFPFASYASLIPLRISLDATRGGRKSTKEVGVHPAYGC